MNKGPVTQMEKDPFPSIEDRLKPLLVSMKILGIYFDPTLAKNKVEPSETYPSRANPSGWWRSVNRVYCYIVLLLLWCNVGRCAVGLFPLDEGLPLRIILTTWVLLCALNATITVVACQKLTHLRSFYKHWDSVFQCPLRDSMGCGSKFPEQYLKIGTATGWFLGLFNVTALCIIMFCNLPISLVYIKAFARPFPESQWVIIFNLVMQVFQSGAWIFPIIFISITARVIRAQFLQLGSVISKRIEEADGHFPDQLPELRFHYTQLCQAVDIVNRSFKWFLGARFVPDIFLACFVSYQIINGPLDIFFIAVNVFWLGCSIMGTLVSAMCSSGVHDAVSDISVSVVNSRPYYLFDGCGIDIGGLGMDSLNGLRPFWG
ncbi:uncharacterized protein [Haliotis asinina]|uniref:uncharacterized protein n=1 Tax=Haliotis asinina TaxID=109174 RepID=UPI0035327BCF